MVTDNLVDEAQPWMYALQDAIPQSRIQACGKEEDSKACFSMQHLHTC